MRFVALNRQVRVRRAGGDDTVAARLADTRGLTLVESVVSLLIVGIVLAAVASVLVFGTNMTRRQEAESNAQTLASTVKASLESALQGATSVTWNDDGSITFTTGTTTYYLGNEGSTYVLSVENGQVKVAPQGNHDGGGDLLPSSTYINGDTVSLSRDENDDRQVKITVKSDSGAELATANTSDVLASNGGAA